MEQRVELSGKNMRVAQILSFCGAVPFIAALAALPLQQSAYWLHLAIFYGAIIISFLAGTHWAVFLFFSTRCPRNLLFSSTSLALVAWLSVLIIQQPLVFVLQCLCFLVLLVADYNLMLASIWRPWYFRLRRNVTIIVITCQLALIAFCGVAA